jgi:hypothetical protein
MLSQVGLPVVPNSMHLQQRSKTLPLQQPQQHATQTFCAGDFEPCVGCF